MNNKIKTDSKLWKLIDIDRKDHKLKDMALLFLNAMNDWSTNNQTNIKDFIRELKEYFGSPLTIGKIDARKNNGQNAWQIEAGSSISEIIEMSTKFCDESDFDKIMDSIFNYYNGELNNSIQNSNLSLK